MVQGCTRSGQVKNTVVQVSNYAGEIITRVLECIEAGQKVTVEKTQKSNILFYNDFRQAFSLRYPIHTYPLFYVQHLFLDIMYVIM